MQIDNDNKLPDAVLISLATGISFILLSVGFKLIHGSGFNLLVITPALIYSAYMITKNTYDVGIKPWIVTMAVADLLILILPTFL